MYAISEFIFNGWPSKQDDGRWSQTYHHCCNFLSSSCCLKDKTDIADQWPCDCCYQTLQNFASVGWKWDNWYLTWIHLAFEDMYDPVHKCQWWNVISKLNLLKSRLRTTMTQKQMVGLPLHCIKRDLLLRIKNDRESLLSLETGYWVLGLSFESN